MSKLLDLKDKKLLYYLSVNARQSHSQLAKKIGLSKNSIKYRIERLKKKGIIKHFACVVNLGSIKYTTITLLLKFNEDIYEKPEIGDYFKKHEFADWVVTLSGQWDIFAEFAVRDIRHLIRMVRDITEKFSDSLSTYQLFYSTDTLRVEHLIGDFYKDLKVEELPRQARTKERHKIGDIDKKILRSLSKDSVMPFLDIAKKLKVSMDVVRYKIKKLKEKGIIIKFFPEISLPKLGYTEYLYTLKLKNINQEKVKKLRNFISSNPNITYAFVDINSYNIIFVCGFKTPEGIDHLSRSLRKEFSEIIDGQNYLIIKEQILFNLFPEGLLK